MNGKERKLLVARFSLVVLRVPRYMLLAANLARDDRLTRSQKVRVLGSLGYALSPIDLLPGIIPMVGQLDDLAVLIGGLRSTMRGLPRPMAEEHLHKAGLEMAEMDRDLAVVAAMGAALARGAAGLVGRALRGSVHFVSRLARPRLQSRVRV